VDIKEMEWKDLDWINLAQNMGQWRNILKMVMNFLGCIKCGEFLEIKYYYPRTLLHGFSLIT
jgi:hypothetical protein